MIRISISPKQRRILDAEMKAFATRAGVAVGEVVAIVGQSCAKELALKIQPWGLTQAKGDKFALNIEKQIRKAARYGIKYGVAGTLDDIYKKYRNKSGTVRGKSAGKFQPKRPLFEKSEIDALVVKQVKKAGTSKAGWIAAGESISSPLLKTAKGAAMKIKGISKWIRRRVNSSVGSSFFKNNGRLSSTVYLTNNVDYAYSSNNSNKTQVSSALNKGYRDSIKMIRSALKKLK